MYINAVHNRGALCVRKISPYIRSTYIRAQHGLLPFLYPRPPHLLSPAKHSDKRCPPPRPEHAYRW